MIDLGDGRIEVRAVAPDGTERLCRVDRVAWLRWWQGLDGPPLSWVGAARERFEAETGCPIGDGQAARLLAGLRRSADDFFAEPAGSSA